MKLTENFIFSIEVKINKKNFFGRKKKLVQENKYYNKSFNFFEPRL